MDGYKKNMQKELLLEKDKLKAVGKANDANIFQKKDANCNFVTATMRISGRCTCASRHLRLSVIEERFDWWTEDVKVRFAFFS
jgi:hypothetical protein